MTTHAELVVFGSASVELRVDEQGSGRPMLILHGGAGPVTMRTLAGRLADTGRALVPTHPGFDGTVRPASIDSIPALAGLYVAWLDQLDLTDVTVIGNSIGGWIAAELALLRSPRVSQIVLIDAVGIEVPGHPVADFFSLTMEQVIALSFHDPAALPPAPNGDSSEARLTAAGNREALRVYAGTGMADAHLADRLAEVAVPTLVIWGESDRIADLDYGRALAEAIPGARFELLAEAGHMPQLEDLDRLVATIGTAG